MVRTFPPRLRDANQTEYEARIPGRLAPKLRPESDLRYFVLESHESTGQESYFMKIVIPGGSGQVGSLLARAFVADDHDVVVLSRHPSNAPWRVVEWDGETVGDWAREINEADVVINLAGRSVNCRYHAEDRRL